MELPHFVLKSSMNKRSALVACSLLSVLRHYFCAYNFILIFRKLSFLHGNFNPYVRENKGKKSDSNFARVHNIFEKWMTFFEK